MSDRQTSKGPTDGYPKATLPTQNLLHLEFTDPIQSQDPVTMILSCQRDRYLQLIDSQNNFAA